MPVGDQPSDIEVYRSSCTSSILPGRWQFGKLGVHRPVVSATVARACGGWLLLTCVMKIVSLNFVLLLLQLQIRKIVLQYISQPSCVILAITAANTDIANSDR